MLAALIGQRSPRPDRHIVFPASEITTMWTPRQAVQLITRRLVHWESIGEWDGGGWHLLDASEGLTRWLSRYERHHPGVWKETAERGRRVTLEGDHFDYRLIPLDAGLMLERRPR